MTERQIVEYIPAGTKILMFKNDARIVQELHPQILNRDFCLSEAKSRKRDPDDQTIVIEFKDSIKKKHNVWGFTVADDDLQRLERIGDLNNPSVKYVVMHYPNKGIRILS